MNYTQRGSMLGSMLIVAIGILTLMIVLVVSFVALMNTEKNASANYVEGVVARNLADSGVARYVGELKSMIQSNPSGNDLAGEVVYAPFWLGDKTAPSKNADGSWQSNYGIPLEDPRGGMYRITVTGEAIPMDGSMGSSFSGGVNQFRVKVIDTTGQLNLNMYRIVKADPNAVPGLPPRPNPYEEALTTLLDDMGKVISLEQTMGRSETSKNPLSIFRYAGARGAAGIVKLRKDLEGAKFSSKSQLKPYFYSEDGPKAYALLRNYITVHSWSDPTAVAPVPDAKPYGGGARVDSNLDRSPINLNTAPKEVLAAVIANISGRFFYRSVFANTQAIDAGHTKFANPNSSMQEEGTQYEHTPLLCYTRRIGIPQAMAIADRILELRQNKTEYPFGFSSVADWERFVDTFVKNGMLPSPSDLTHVVWENGGSIQDGRPIVQAFTGSAVQRWENSYRAACRSALKANFNPSWIPVQYNPSFVAYRPSVAKETGSSKARTHLLVGAKIDKANLTAPRSTPPYVPLFGQSGSWADFLNNHVIQQTTDFCFQSRGVYEITSLGEVLTSTQVQIRQDKKKGTTLPAIAQSKIRTIIKMLDVVTHRTQKDFETNRLDYETGDPYDPTPEDPRRFVQTYPEHDYNFLVDSTDPRDRQKANRGVGANENAGYIEIAPLRWMWDFDKAPEDAVTTAFAKLGPKPRDHPSYGEDIQDFGEMFAALWDKKWHRTDRKADYMAQKAGSKDFHATGITGPGPAVRGLEFAYGTPVHRVDRVDNRGQLFADGYLSTWLGGYHDKKIFRRNQHVLPFVWYRAGWNPYYKDSGNSEHAENPIFGLPTLGGSTVNWAGWNSAQYEQGKSELFFDPPAPRTTATENKPNPRYTSNPYPGNVLPHQGGVEFWYKPDFDWGYGPTNNRNPNPTLAGLFHISSVHRNPNMEALDSGYATGPDKREVNIDRTTGTQLFCFRNSRGDLRLTMLYFEVVGKGPEEEAPTKYEAGVWPLNSQASPAPDLRGGSGTAITIPQAPNTNSPIEEYGTEYILGGNQSPNPQQIQWPPREIAGDLKDTINGAPGADGTWDRELDGDTSWMETPNPSLAVQKIGASPLFKVAAFARVDGILPFKTNKLKDWKAGEWHHIAIRWDNWIDSPAPHQVTQNPQNTMYFWIDGEPVLTNKEIQPWGSSNPNSAFPITAPDAFPDGGFHERIFISHLNEPVFRNSSDPPRPMDVIQIGGISRRQQKRGGLFKWAAETPYKDPAGTDRNEALIHVPANGTMDDFRIYDGTMVDTANFSEVKSFAPYRYYEPLNGGEYQGSESAYQGAGVYTNHFDLSNRIPGGAPHIEVAAMFWTVHVPDTFAEGNLNEGFNTGGAAIEVLKGQTPFNDNSEKHGRKTANWPKRPNAPNYLTHKDSPSFVTMGKQKDSILPELTLTREDLRNGQTIGYRLGLWPAIKGGRAVASPVVDEVGLIILFPKEQIIFQEQLYD